MEEGLPKWVTLFLGAPRRAEIKTNYTNGQVI